MTNEVQIYNAEETKSRRRKEKKPTNHAKITTAIDTMELLTRYIPAWKVERGISSAGDFGMGGFCGSGGF